MAAKIKRSLHLLEFGPYRLNVMERLLFRGEEVVALTPKVFEMLAVLVENAGHVMSKEELLTRLWPDSFVEESSLTQNISMLRKALGEDTSRPQYIETIPKLGYRFIAEVKAVYEAETEIIIHQGRNETALVEEEDIHRTDQTDSHDLSQSHLTVPSWKWKTYALLAGFVLAAIVFAVYLRIRLRGSSASVGAIKSIAVLPFKTIGVEDEKDILGLGMADAIILRLSKQETLLTLPTSTIYKYTNQGRDILAIGRELGVDAVLDGTVQRGEGRVRVTAQLIRLSDGKTLWADKFDEEYSNIFTVQDSLSEKLSETLMLKISSGDKERIARRFTQNTEAYQSYLMGLYFWNRGRQDIIKSIPYFERAIEQDPNFAMAYAYLADCYYYNAATKSDAASYDESIKRAKDNVAKALLMDETIAEAHTAVAGIKTLEKDYAGAEVEHKRALALNPNFARGHNRYGVFLFHMSDLDGAVRELRRGQELDPASRVSNQALSHMLYFARKYDEAIKYGSRAVEIDPDYDPGRTALGEAYLMKGMYDEAIAQFEQIIKNPASSSFFLAKEDLAIAYANQGRKAEAEKILQELLFRSLQSEKPYSPYDFAIIYAALGDKDKAFELLEKDKKTHYKAALFNFDPALDSLRSDSRFTRLLQSPVLADYEGL